MPSDNQSGVPLDAAQLCASFSATPIETDAAAASPAESGDLIGQERALDAIRLAARIPNREFNLFVMGRPGYGRHSSVFRVLEEEARDRPVPGDWVYVNNFENSDKPIALELPTGMAAKLKRAMEVLVDDLANEIPAIFESEDYQHRRRAIEQGFGEQHEKAFGELMESAREQDLTILRTPMGFGVAATREGKPMTPDVFQALPSDERDRLDHSIKEIQSRLEEVLRQVPAREKARRAAVAALNAEVAKTGVDGSIDQLIADFGHVEGIKTYLETVRADLVENAGLFLETNPQADAGAFPVVTAKRYQEPQFRRYAVNAMICNSDEQDSAPVIAENLPTLGNLVGRSEHASHMGALVTDFTMIKPGALHRANGGYLVIDVRQILSEPFAWEALKRCLQTRQISISSAQQRLSVLATASLDPDPIPLNVRVALIGERIFFYLLTANDPDFATLFKVQADFNDEIAADEENAALFAKLIGDIVAREQLRKLDASAVARLMVEATRLSDDAEKLSLDIGQLTNILREAEYWAAAGGKTAIAGQHVEEAISQAETRASRPQELAQEAIARETLLIDTDGSVAGQINALSVVQVGTHRFGRPSRVTARVRMGRNRVVDIEREVELGGPLHSKGVLILSGYLATHFALDVPMSLWASIVFEQSYGGVDGDSASAAELFCLLSALSGKPIDQSFAVTGSVNQQGHIQAIGGVNEKIEGFFDICAAKGLTGRQGVLIPKSNVKNLALRTRVVDAVKAGKFSVIAIETIDQGIEALTGCAAGARDEEGAYPDQSINGLVEARLREFAHGLRAFARSGKGDGAGSSEEMS